MAREPLRPITLPPETIVELEDMAGDLKIMDAEIAKAKRAGIPVGELEKRWEETKKLRLGLLKEYK